MNPEQKMVEEFHKAFDILVSKKSKVPDLETIDLRERLIEEEFMELSKAFTAQDIVSVADALADLLYVIYGTAVSCGLDMEPIFREVHRSNMTKAGGHKRKMGAKAGKWIKPAGYSPPNLHPFIVK